MKVVFFAFKGESMCFIHVLLNALDLQARKGDVKIVFEGEATKLIPEMAREGHPLSGLYRQVRSLGLIDCACRACSNKMGVLAEVEKEGIPLLDEMSGHPSMAHYLGQGFQVITL